MSKGAATLREWLKGKTAADLGMIEHAGRMHFPDKVFRLGKDGTFIEVPVLVRVPRIAEKAQARREAIELFNKWKLDRDKDDDYFATLNRFAILSHAIRDPEDGVGRGEPPQFQPLEWLMSREPGKGFDDASLWNIWERVKIYDELLEPGITEPTTEDVIAAVIGIDAVRNLSPLAVIAGSAVEPFVISMAVHLASFLRGKPSLQSTETSPPAS